MLRNKRLLLSEILDPYLKIEVPMRMAAGGPAGFLNPKNSSKIRDEAIMVAKATPLIGLFDEPTRPAMYAPEATRHIGKRNGNGKAPTYCREQEASNHHEDNHRERNCNIVGDHHENHCSWNAQHKHSQHNERKWNVSFSSADGSNSFIV